MGPQRAVQGAEVIFRALRMPKLFFSARGTEAQTALTQTAHSRETSPNSDLSPLGFSDRSRFSVKPQTHLFQHDHEQYVTAVLCHVISTGHHPAYLHIHTIPKQDAHPKHPDSINTLVRTTPGSDPFIYSEAAEHSLGTHPNCTASTSATTHCQQLPGQSHSARGSQTASKTALTVCHLEVVHKQVPARV